MRSRSVPMFLVAIVALAVLVVGCGGGNNTGFKNCGNGVLDPGEECDDGNLIDTDACLSTCELNVCGDGVLDNGVEQCDGGQLGTGTCSGLGFSGGTISCTAQCTFDTSACTGTGGLPTPTPGATPSSLATRGVTPTVASTPSGATCKPGDQIVVVASLSKSYGGAQIELGYPSSAVNIPGTGSASTVFERVKFVASDGLTAVSDDRGTSGGAVDDTLTASLVGSSDHPAGAFVAVTFDCITDQTPPTSASFTCTVASASTATGDTIPDEQCSIAAR